MKNASGMFQRTIETTQMIGWNYRFSGRRTGTRKKKNQCEKRCGAVRIRLKDKSSPLIKSSLEMSWRKPLFSVSHFQEAGLSPMIALTIKSGESILLKMLRKSKSFAVWSTSTAGSSSHSHRKCLNI